MRTNGAPVRVLALVALASGVTVGCGDDGGKKTPTGPDPSLLPGIWEPTRVVVQAGPQQYELTPEQVGLASMEIMEDGTGIASDGEVSEEFDWTAQGSQMTVVLESGRTDTYAYNVSSTTLSMSFQVEEAGVTYVVTAYFTRQTSEP